MPNYGRLIRTYGRDIANETSGGNFKAYTKEGGCAQVPLGVGVLPGDVLNDPEWPNHRLLVSEVRQDTRQQLVYFHPFHLTGRIIRYKAETRDHFGRPITSPVTAVNDVPLVSDGGYFLVFEKVDIVQGDVVEVHQTNEVFVVRAVSIPISGLRKLVVTKQELTS